MAVRLIILDCDLTLWNHPNVTGLALPFRRAADDAVEDRDGVRVTLFPGVRRMLDGLRERGLIVACASWNEPRPVEEIFTVLGLDGYFDHRKVEPHPHKDRTIRALLDDLRQRDIALRPDQVLYVDDRRIHLGAIHATVGPIRFLQFGVDVRSPDEVLAYIDGADGATSPPARTGA